MDTRTFKAGSFRKQQEYKSFLPELVDREWMINEPKLAALQSAADRKLGELNAAGRWIAETEYFIRMHIAKEATTSSKIEGTQTTMEEALEQSANIDIERRDDWQEVRNHIDAMNFAIERLKKLPLSNRLLKETHVRLLTGVRGKHKNPGEFRRSQNWLGPSLKHAIYVPPVHSEVEALMSDLEKFLNNTRISVPPLTRIALAHYQFETIHPFLDGNGRLGRLMITLYLVSAGLLSKPTLYLSDFFERNRSEYYDLLTRVREKNELDQWLKFFFVGVIETAERSVLTFEKIVELKQQIETKKLIKLGKRSAIGADLLHLLYKEPILGRHRLEAELELSLSTASRLLQDFEQLGILREMTGFSRNRRYAFSEYIDIFR